MAAWGWKPSLTISKLRSPFALITPAAQAGPCAAVISSGSFGVKTNPMVSAQLCPRRGAAGMRLPRAPQCERGGCQMSSSWGVPWAVSLPCPSRSPPCPAGSRSPQFFPTFPFQTCF